MDERGDVRGGGGGRPGQAQRIFRWIAAGLAVALVVVSLSAYLTYRSVWDSITRISVGQLGPQPRKFNNATNILLIGSDSRAGPNQRFGAGIPGQRSDTIIVLHVAPGRQGVVALSIPRDSVVPVLSCPPEPGAPGQQAQPGQIEQINATFAYGGPGCLWKTIEQTTHLHLDHFIELNFTGFEQVINDVGGVNVCLPFAISDPLSKLRLGPGMHHVNGAEALAFWRARYIGDGSDLERIRRDQYLMVSMIQGVKRKGVLDSPATTLSVVTDAARWMTTDSGLTVSEMLGITDSLRNLPPGSVQFVELPTVPYSQNPNWVSWPSSDNALFSAIAHDRTGSPTSTRPSAGRHVALSASAARARQGAARSGAPASDAASSADARLDRTGSGAPHGLSGTYGGITGSTNLCHDGSAFAGPDGGS
jgi:LCP family protein required for cell wall assembly